MERTPDQPCCEEYRMINRNLNAIEKGKVSHGKEWTKHASGDSAWTIHEYMKANPSDYDKQRNPNLRKPDGTPTRRLANTTITDALLRSFNPHFLLYVYDRL